MDGNYDDQSIREKEEDERDKHRQNDGQSRNLRQDKGRIIPVDQAPPEPQRVNVGLPMVTPLLIPAAMKVKRPSFWRFKVAEAGITDQLTRQPNHDQQTGEQASYERSSSLPSNGMHEAERVKHE